MKKRILSSVVIGCALCVTISPAWADNQSSGSTGAALPASKSAAQKSMGARMASWPLCIAGFACGTIVGTPICFVRKLPDEVRNLASGFVGSFTENKSKLLLIPAGICWLPFAGTAALIEAPAYAWKDAYMAEKPFSKEQFSLGAMDQASDK